jgi:hypothetical protein
MMFRQLLRRFGLNFFPKGKEMGKTLTFGRILYIIVMLSEVPDFSEETL